MIRDTTFGTNADNHARAEHDNLIRMANYIDPPVGHMDAIRRERPPTRELVEIFGSPRAVPSCRGPMRIAYLKDKPFRSAESILAPSEGLSCHQAETSACRRQ